MKINAGLTFKHTFVLSDYSADDSFEVRGFLTNSSQAYALATGLFAGDGTSWELTIPKATTATYAAGEYALQLIAADGTEDLQAFEGAVTIAAAMDAARETRSDNQIILDQLNVVVKTKSTQDHLKLSIEGRSIERMSWEDILKAQQHFQKLVSAERRAASGGSQIRTHQVGFSNG